MKFEQNVMRDRRNYELLRKARWNILTVWECEVADIEKVCERIEMALMLSK